MATVSVDPLAEAGALGSPSSLTHINKDGHHKATACVNVVNGGGQSTRLHKTSLTQAFEWRTLPASVN